MDRKPHTCPNCEGRKTKDGQPCPTCDATGVVWSVEEAAVGAGDALDLTDYPAP